ncbi:MAG: hypothetical protein E7022_01835 [Desulfovibrio desulfuricans]|jgi:small-conductance mechanosensitive channel|nr:hypothetical protein [Desulfovibrio desulfuricans]
MDMMHGLDAWLWRRGIDHPVIRAVLRNEILLAAAFLLAGGLLYAVTAWFFWFGAGAAIMAWTFWGLARFFLRNSLGEYSSAFLRVVILRWLGRFLVIGALLYLALAVCRAPVFAVAGGLTAAGLCALVSYALAARSRTE